MGKLTNIWRLCLCIVMAGFLMLPTTAEAYDGIGNDEEEIYADEWFSKNNRVEGNGQRRMNRRHTDAENTEDEETLKYVWLMDDDNYSYYVDNENLHWERIPYRAAEYMLNVWLMLIPKNADFSEGNGNKYYLEHYYMHPKKRQIQFLCELEVRDRPQNTISEREYDIKNWEDLVPGSMEDQVYTCLMKTIKEKKIGGSGKPGESFRDKLEEYLRISL